MSIRVQEVYKTVSIIVCFRVGLYCKMLDWFVLTMTKHFLSHPFFAKQSAS